MLSDVAVHTIFGRGPDGYRAALRHLVNRASCPVETRRYGPHPDQVFDLRPGSGRRGAALVHGGFWLDTWGRDTTESWAVDLHRRGVATANLEYRRLGSGGGVVPTLADVAEALAGCGFDWLLLDGEHAPNDPRSVLDQLRATAPYDTHTVVRAPAGAVSATPTYPRRWRRPPTLSPRLLRS